MNAISLDNIFVSILQIARLFEAEAFGSFRNHIVAGWSALLGNGLSSTWEAKYPRYSWHLYKVTKVESIDEAAMQIFAHNVRILVHSIRILSTYFWHNPHIWCIVYTLWQTALASFEPFSMWRNYPKYWKAEQVKHATRLCSGCHFWCVNYPKYCKDNTYCETTVRPVGAYSLHPWLHEQFLVWSRIQTKFSVLKLWGVGWSYV